MFPPAGSRRRRAQTLLAFVVLLAVISASCRSVLSRKYEYDEEIYLSLDGSATLYVNASVPALVALRGVALDVDPRARLDRQHVRAIFDTPVSRVAHISTSRRDNRRYVHLRIDVDDIERLHESPAFAWSRYALEREDNLLKYRQTIGVAAAADVGEVGWTGAELIAVRLRLPSRVPFHNSPARRIERGNIIVWEQPLTERLSGETLQVVVHMETSSILVRTLVLFGITILLAAASFVLAIWWVVRRGRGTVPPVREESPPTAA
jgi:hypothetical protein